MLVLVCVCVCICVILLLFDFCYSCVKYVPEPEDSILLTTSLNIYRKFKHYSKALQLALQLNDLDLIREIFLSAKENL